jgi:hypothetical protein
MSSHAESALARRSGIDAYFRHQQRPVRPVPNGRMLQIMASKPLIIERARVQLDALRLAAAVLRRRDFNEEIGRNEQLLLAAGA